MLGQYVCRQKLPKRLVVVWKMVLKFESEYEPRKRVDSVLPFGGEE
jgi:hypothetical protein